MDNFFVEKILRLTIIILAIISAVVFVYYVVNPYLLEPLSFIDTENSLKIYYRTNGNTALIYIDPINRWLFYNDKKLYTFTPENTGHLCDKEGFSLAYVVNATDKLEEIGYECIPNIKNLIEKYYPSKNEDWEVVFHKLDINKDIGPQILTSQQIINILLKKRIIYD